MVGNKGIVTAFLGPAVADLLNREQGALSDDGSLGFVRRRSWYLSAFVCASRKAKMLTGHGREGQNVTWLGYTQLGISRV